MKRSRNRSVSHATEKSQAAGRASKTDKLFVGNLPFDSLSDDIAIFFSRVLRLNTPLPAASVQLLAPGGNAPAGATCNGCAVITLPSDASDAKTLGSCVGSETLPPFHGRSPRVNWQSHRSDRVRSSVSTDLQRAVVIANIPFHSSEGELRSVLQTFLDATVAYLAAAVVVTSGADHRKGLDSSGSAAHQRKRRLVTKAASVGTSVVTGHQDGEASQSELRALKTAGIERWGVENVRLMGAAEDEHGGGGGVAVVVLTHEKAAAAVVAASHRLKIGRRVVRCDWSVPKELRDSRRRGGDEVNQLVSSSGKSDGPAAKRSVPHIVLIGPLHEGVEASAVRAACEPFGVVQRLAWAGSGESGRSVVVVFGDAESAARALTKGGVRLGAQIVKVTRAVVV